MPRGDGGCTRMRWSTARVAFEKPVRVAGQGTREVRSVPKYPEIRCGPIACVAGRLRHAMVQPAREASAA